MRWQIPAIIVLLLIAGMATQVLAAVTEHDHIFGVVPKLNPAGSRNVPVWFGSGVIAVSAIVASVMAIAGSTIKTDRRWLALAAVLLVVSIERLTWPNRGLFTILQQSFGTEFVLVLLALFSAVGLSLYVACVRGMSAVMTRQLIMAAVIFLIGAVTCAAVTWFGGVRGARDEISLVGAMAVGRLLEVAGPLWFIRVLGGHAVRERMLVTIDSACESLLARHERGGRLELRVSPLCLRFWLLVVSTVVIAAGVMTAAVRMQNVDVRALDWFLNVDLEGNLPTWWSALLLLSCGIASAAIASVHHQAGDSLWRHWRWLALMFVLLSLDEAASFHEMLVLPMRDLLGNNPWLRYPLIVPGVIIAAITFAFFRRFLRSVPATFRRSLLSGFAVFLFGALVIETVGGWYEPLGGRPSFTYAALAASEEACEMFGITILLVALLQFGERSFGTIQLTNQQH